MKYLFLIPVFIICSCAKRDTNSSYGVRGSNYVSSSNGFTPSPVANKTILRLINNGNKCSFLIGKSWSKYGEVAPNSVVELELNSGNFEYTTFCSSNAFCNFGSGSAPYKTIYVIENSYTDIDVSCY